MAYNILVCDDEYRCAESETGDERCARAYKHNGAYDADGDDDGAGDVHGDGDEYAN